MGDGGSGRTDRERAGTARKPLASIATLLDLYRVGGLSNPRDLRMLAEATEDPHVVDALHITEDEVTAIRRRADASP